MKLTRRSRHSGPRFHSHELLPILNSLGFSIRTDQYFSNDWAFLHSDPKTPEGAIAVRAARNQSLSEDPTSIVFMVSPYRSHRHRIVRSLYELPVYPGEDIVKKFQKWLPVALDVVQRTRADQAERAKDAIRRDTAYQRYGRELKEQYGNDNIPGFRGIVRNSDGMPVGVSYEVQIMGTPAEVLAKVRLLLDIKLPYNHPALVPPFAGEGI